MLTTCMCDGAAFLLAEHSIITEQHLQQLVTVNDRPNGSLVHLGLRADMHGAGAAIPGLTCRPIFYWGDPERKIIIIIPDVACMASTVGIPARALFVFSTGGSQ